MKKNLLLGCKCLVMLSQYSLFGLVLQCIVANTIVASDSYGQKLRDVHVSVIENNISLEQAFEVLESMTGFRFIYNSKKIPINQKLDLSEAKGSLEDVLIDISKQFNLKFRRVNNLISVSPKPEAEEAIVEVEEIMAFVQGKITDEESGEPLTGATVRISGTTQGATTSLNGEFSLRIVQSEAVLEINYIGYESKMVPVSLSNGQTQTLTISLKNSVTHLEGIVVTGALQGQAKALNQQKSADNIKNIVAADQISRFPDPNVAEALQRIPGVNIERDQGEGRYVFVRGLSPKFTNVSVNGEQIPSPEADVRFVALDAIPADQLASIEVNKTLTPDMDGDAVGGSINLITRTAQSRQPDISGSLVGGYNNLMNKANSQFSLQYGQRFGSNEKLGVLLNASHYLADRGSDNWERAIDDNEVELRDYELRRTRLGLSGTFDYKFNPKNELYFRALYTKFDDHEFRRTFLFVGDEDEPEIERATKDRYEAQIVQSYNFGGKHSFSGFTLDYEGAYSYGEQDTPDDFEVVFVGEPESIEFDFANKDYPGISVNAGEDFNGYTDRNLYEFDEFEFGGTKATDQNITGKFNILVPYQIGGNSASLKFGGKMRLKKKDFRINVNFVEWAGDDDLLLSGLNGEGPDFTGGLVDENFLGGRYSLDAQPDLDKVISFYNNNLNGFEHNLEDKLADEALESYTATEDVYAGYAMTTINLNKLMFTGGLRYEYTSVNYDSKNVIFNEDGDLEAIENESGGTNYGYLLPQVNARYALGANANLRAAVTYSYSRPNFAEIVPAQEFNLEDREVSIGNALLEPVSAFNIDLMAERYFGSIGIISGGLFYKNLDNFIYSTVFRTQSLNGRQFDETVRVFQTVNGDQANLFGLELAYQQNLTFLPGILKGLGVYANYTFTRSNAEISSLNDNDEMITETINLPGQANHMGNLSLSYNFGRLTTRLSANFNGRYLSEIDEGNEIYMNDRMQLDFNASYRVGKGWQVFAEMLNLTNQPLEAYQNSRNLLIQREFYSWWSRFGIKFDLN